MQASSEAGHSCNCIGPQNGQPVCPCRMKGVTIEAGRYVEKRDLGPVRLPAPDSVAYPRFNPYKLSIWDGV